MNYRPVPCTTPFRFIELLGASEELSTSQLAAELDIPSSQIHAFMKSALSHGAVTADRRGNATYWKLGCGTPPTPASIEQDDDPVVQRVVPATEPPPPRPTLSDLHGVAADCLAGPASEEIVESSQSERAPAEQQPLSPEELLADEVLDRLGFPVPEGKHTISRNTCLYIRGGRGAGSFVLRYVAPSGQRREMGLGSFIARSRAMAVTAIAKIIRLADEKLALVGSGVDPLADADGERPLVTAPAPAHAAELVPTQKPAMRCAVWSDGALSIEHHGQRIELPADEARKLCDYLDVVRGGAEA